MTEGKIANLAVTTAKIAETAITNAKIANAAVDTAQIALGAITTALIAQGAIGTAQIADASITAAKVVSLNADVITSGTLATERLIITGAKGLIYEINAEASGLSVHELSDQKYQEQINGTVMPCGAYALQGAFSMLLLCPPAFLIRIFLLRHSMRFVKLYCLSISFSLPSTSFIALIS